MIIVILIIAGLTFGSFINAAVWRLRQQELAQQTGDSSRKTANSPKPAVASSLQSTDYSLLKGRSVCPKCSHQLSARDLVPVLSWLLLRGKCRYCGKPIALHYPAVELLSAGLFVWSYLVWDFSSTGDGVNFGVWLAILTGLIILALYDLRWMELPNRILYPLMVLVAGWLIVRAMAQGSITLLTSHLGAALVAGGLFYIIFFISKERWMGGGDVKLAFLMGLILGGQKILVAMFVGFNLAAIVSLILIASRKLTRKDLIPFGPFLIAGTIVAMLYGSDLVNAYVNFFTVY